MLSFGLYYQSYNVLYEDLFALLQAVSIRYHHLLIVVNQIENGLVHNFHLFNQTYEIYLLLTQNTFKTSIF